MSKIFSYVKYSADVEIQGGRWARLATRPAPRFGLTEPHFQTVLDFPLESQRPLWVYFRFTRLFPNRRPDGTGDLTIAVPQPPPAMLTITEDGEIDVVRPEVELPPLRINHTHTVKSQRNMRIAAEILLPEGTSAIARYRILKVVKH